MKSKSLSRLKVFTLIGDVLVFIPIGFTIIISIIGSTMEKKLLFDFLMPAELFLFVLIGSIVLLIASFLSKYYKKYIILNMIIMISSLFMSQFMAVITGLAHGDNEPVGWRLYLVMTFLILYILSVFFEFILGILLLKKINKSYNQ